MQMCPFCDKVYDESDYSHCPYCSGELEDNVSERFFKNCPIVMVSCIGMVAGNAQIVDTKWIPMKMITMAL